MSLAVIHLIFYVLGFVALCAFCSCQLRRPTRQVTAGGSCQSESAGVPRWSYFLYWKFKPQRYFWGVALPLRSLLFCLTPVVSRSPHLQVVLIQYILMGFIALHTYFWPYRQTIHNVADLVVQVLVASLMGAAGFLLIS